MTDDEKYIDPGLRNTIANILVNASNFPEKVAPRILGQDMGPLINKVTEAVDRYIGISDSDAARCAVTAVACPECQTVVNVPISVSLVGDPGEQGIVCDPDLSDLWAHMWTHELGASDD